MDGVVQSDAGYSYSVRVGCDRLGWHARIGAPGARYRTEKRLVVSRTSFLVASSETTGGGQRWPAGAGDGGSRPVTYLLSPMHGAVRVRYGAADAVLAPGQYTVCSSAEPIAADYGDSCRVILVFAGHGGQAREDQVAHALGQAMSADAVVTLLLRHVDAAVHVAGTLAPGSLGAAADAAGDLMAAVLAGLPANGTREATLRSQIETFIELRLREPGLNARQIASAHYVSLRTVHRLLEGVDEGVASYVRGRRLDRCQHEILSRPDLSLAAICERWSMGDPSTSPGSTVPASGKARRRPGCRPTRHG
jgi:hypothetical protein